MKNISFNVLVLGSVLGLAFCSSQKAINIQSEQIVHQKTSPNRSPASNSWANYHWARTGDPFTLKVGNKLTSDWVGYLVQASSDWNSPTTFGAASTPLLTAIATGAAGTARKCSMSAGTVQVCNAGYGKNGWLGLASINTSGDHITQGSAKMNDSYFTSSTYNNPNEKLHVMCQEVAHTFGLDHQSTDGTTQNTCMDYFSNTGANATSLLSTRPNAHDFDELNIIYTHLDSSTTLAYSASALASENSDDPRAWGRLVNQSPDGRSSYYENNNGQNQTLTHVYWTEETAAECPSCDHRKFK